MSRQLNDKQITTLKTVLKFRYVTTDNLALHRNITQNSAYSSLEILNKTGYLGKIHDKSYRLLNKSARYFLTPEAVVYLHNTVGVKLPDAIWNSRRRDDKRSSDFIDHQVAIHTAYNALNESLGEVAQIKSALELYGTEGIIKPLPGLLVEPKSGKPFFVELTDGEHLFLVKKRIRKYVENYDANDWEWKKYPDVFIVRASAADRTRLRKYTEERMEDGYLDDDDFSFYIVSAVNKIRV
jgi:hypothetical protein